MLLPVTENQFEEFCDKISALHPDIADRQKIAASLAMAIAHLPKEQSSVEVEFMASIVRKACSTHLAQFCAQMYGHRASVDALVSDIKAGGETMQQSIDQLTKAATEGSEYAAKALKTLG